MHPNKFYWSSEIEHVRDDRATFIFAVGSKYTRQNYLIFRYILILWYILHIFHVKELFSMSHSLPHLLHDVKIILFTIFSQ